MNLPSMFLTPFLKIIIIIIIIYFHSSHDLPSLFLMFYFSTFQILFLLNLISLLLWFDQTFFTLPDSSLTFLHSHGILWSSRPLKIYSSFSSLFPLFLFYFYRAYSSFSPILFCVCPHSSILFPLSLLQNAREWRKKIEEIHQCSTPFRNEISTSSLLKRETRKPTQS